MPAAIQRACATHGCLTLTEDRLCPACTTRRGSARARGYTTTWDKYRVQFLLRYRRCGDRPPGAPVTTDSLCRLNGYVTAARVVDHIVPVTGPHDPTFLIPACHQALCDPCHNAKRQREARR